MSSDLSLEFLRVVEQAAIACAHTMGQGDRHKSDQAAVEAMRRTLDTVPIDGTIVIGEGERDEAPMLYIGEKVGHGRAQAAADPRSAEGRHRRRSARGHEPVRDRRAERDRRARRVRRRRPAARARSLHGEARRRARARSTRSTSMRRSRDNLRGDRDAASIGASRISSSSCSIGRATRSSSPRSARPARASG